MKQAAPGLLVVLVRASAVLEERCFKGKKEKEMIPYFQAIVVLIQY